MPFKPYEPKIYNKMVSVKPQIRDVLWAYERKGNLGECVDKMGELLDDVWNYALEQAAKEIDKYDLQASQEIRDLKL